MKASETQRLFDACAVTDGGRARHPASAASDAAGVALLYGLGLRRAEVVALDVEDLDRETGALLIRGKGSKVRTVYLTNGARAAVVDWLEHRGDEPGPLLCPVNRAGVVTVRRMTDQALYLALRRLGKRAGLSSLSPHDMRRTFCGDMLDAGADLAVVQAMMGHASPTTTAKYDRRGERAKRAAAELRSVPYSRGA
ncbi:MAG: tyrosine-type recombinase/integrase [Acidobacteriota bacterium]